MANSQKEPVGVIIMGGDYQGLGIARSLSKKDIPIFILDHELCIGRFSRDKQSFFRCPKTTDQTELLDFLHALAARESCRGWVIFPTTDEGVRFLSQNRPRLDSRFRIPTPVWDITKHFYDKRLSHQLASRLGVPVPKTWWAESVEAVERNDTAFPAVIKPAIKDHFYPKTKQKAVLVRNKQELIAAYGEASRITDSSEIMVQELIPGGPEHLYSYCCLFKDGNPVAKLMGRRRRQHPMDFGHASTFVETVDVPELEESSKRLLRAAGYYGLCEVEFKYDERDGKYKLLEVNPRTWGWHTLGLTAGVNFPHLLFRDTLGYPIIANGYRKDVKWVRMLTDLPTAFREIAGGRMTPAEYVKSLRGEKELAVFSWSDPLPFFAEILLVPYLWRKRGF